MVVLVFPFLAAPVRMRKLSVIFGAITEISSKPPLTMRSEFAVNPAN
jgi:hypothetical protein